MPHHHEGVPANEARGASIVLLNRYQLEDLVITHALELQIANNQLLLESEERQEIQTKLAHAQKMEAIGTLARRGHIQVASIEGQGTTIQSFFPATTANGYTATALGGKTTAIPVEFLINECIV